MDATSTTIYDDHAIDPANGLTIGAQLWAFNRAHHLRIAHGVLRSGEVIPQEDARWMQAVICFEPWEADDYVDGGGLL